MKRRGKFIIEEVENGYVVTMYPNLVVDNVPEILVAFNITEACKYIEDFIYGRVPDPKRWAWMPPDENPEMVRL